MLIQTINIDGIKGKEYDSLLASGWFRSKGVIYKSDLVCMDECVSSVRHIRYNLKDFNFKKRHLKLLRRNDRIFNIRVSPICITPEAEELYALQTARFKGFIHQKLSEFIFPFTTENSFNTLQLEVFDGNQLVAVSFFDLGKNAAASILCVYDPEYASYSLGIYTMLKEIDYLKANNIDYYYPGYVLDRPSCFDYKLTLGNCHWMGSNGKWYAALPAADHFSQAMKLEEKMAELRVRLSVHGIYGKMVFYPFYTAAYFSEVGDSLVKYPCYFLLEDDESEYAIAYDLDTEDFVVFRPHANDLYTTQLLDFSSDYRNSDKYEMRIMQSYSLGVLTHLESFVHWFSGSTKVTRFESDKHVHRLFPTNNNKTLS